MTETQSTQISPDALPELITAFLVAHRARDVDTAVGFYTPDAEVTDEGQTYTGPEAIGAWMANAASEYTYTVAVTGAAKIDDTRFDVRHHLEGNFPGGVADLHFRFTLRDGRIARLVIEG